MRLQNQFLILTLLQIIGRHVDRKFIVHLIKGFYKKKKNHHSLCDCFKCKRFVNILQEIERWSFYDLNRTHNKWFVIVHNKYDPEITIFLDFI